VPVVAVVTTVVPFAALAFAVVVAVGDAPGPIFYTPRDLVAPFWLR
jgi:hypothetical protein